MELKENIYKAIELSEDEQITELLQAFLIANDTRNKSNKIDLFKFCDIKNTRGYCKGVYYDANTKLAVATDSFILITSKKDYNEAYAGKLITNKGERVEIEKYPNYDYVIKSGNKDATPTEKTLTKAQLTEAIKIGKIQKKTTKSFIMIKLADRFFISLKNAELILPFVESGLKLNKSGVLSYSDNNYQLICMGCYYSEHYKVFNDVVYVVK